jgi:hypothetical protein
LAHPVHNSTTIGSISNSKTKTTMTTNTTIPPNPETVDGMDNKSMHEQKVAWRKWSKYIERLNQEKDDTIKEKELAVKLKDATISELRQRESDWVTVNRCLTEQLDHYKDMVHYLFHRPYRPKPKSSKRSTKNKGNE